ncbi:hypothetical protein NPIL_253041 [Nephila pilipes]|uniref:Uncharacterized protein n=1 Tax=Nephila pilipes TaxID=299642 RepID=A0A8X6NH04_NEPPI|nr:hypothetical protein NPIL_253041 [Nephila pilipes]
MFHIGLIWLVMLRFHYYTVVPRHTSAPTYEFFEIRAGELVIFCFELRAKFEIRVRFSRSAGSSTRPRATRSRPSRSVNQLAAYFRCDKLCSCVRVLCCIYIYSCSLFIFITMDRKKVCEKSSAKKKLFEEHTQELTTEEIQELQSQQHTEVMQEIGFE